MKILYFAWLREQMGKAQEIVSPPASVTTPGRLADWLAERDHVHASAFADRSRLRVAVNQDQAGFDDPIAADDEIAFFPPMTGG